MPLLEKWQLGGGNVLRGFFQGRYRDNNLWTAQVEYRYGVHRLVKLALFAGLATWRPKSTAYSASRCRRGMVPAFGCW